MGKRLTQTIINEAGAASFNLSSDANSNACTASVLKLNGLKISVAGDSFNTSTNTINRAVKKELFIKGTWIFLRISKPLLPKDLAALSILGFILSKPL